MSSSIEHGDEQVELKELMTNEDGVTEELELEEVDTEEVDPIFVNKDLYEKMWFTNLIARFPKIAALLFLLIPIGMATTAAFFPLQIDYGVDAFRIEDHIVAERSDAFSAAKNEFKDQRQKNEELAYGKTSRFIEEIGDLKAAYELTELADPDHEQAYFASDLKRQYVIPPLSYAKWKLDIVFTVPEGDTVFRADYLQAMQRVQDKITGFAGYKDHCVFTYASGDTPKCQFPESPLEFFYFDGSYKGEPAMLPQQKIDEGVKYILELGLYAYTAKNFSARDTRSNLLRCQFNWGFPLKGYTDYDDRRGEQYSKVENFLNSYIPLLNSLDKPLGDLKLNFGGDYITATEIRQTFWSDATLAFGSLVAIFFFLWFNMSSLFLAIAGLGEIVLSFPAGYFIYRVILGVPYVGILNGISLFIIMGIGVDDLFIFYNFFMQGAKIPTIEERLAWTYRKAAKATFLTSATTAAAFASNLTSQIPALRLFGVFMAMMVMMNYLMVITFFPAILVIYEKQWLPLTRKCVPNFAEKISDRFHQLENRLCYNSGYGRTGTSANSRKLRAGDRFFYEKFSPMIRKFRFVILGIFILSLGGAIYSMLQLKPSSTVPKFFPDGHNVQVFMDWENAGVLDGDLDLTAFCNGDITQCPFTIPKTSTSSVTSTSTSRTTRTTGQTTTSTTSRETTSSQETSQTSQTSQTRSTQETTSTKETTSSQETSQTSQGTTRTSQKTSQTSQETSTSQGTTRTSQKTSQTSQETSTSQGTTQTTKETTSSQETSQTSQGTSQTSQKTSSTTRPTTSTSTQRPSTSTTNSPPTSTSCNADKCGVCNGNNDCLGCDGVPYSGKHYDVCGICDGDGTSCIGCDGKPNGAKMDDCGVCGGNNDCKNCDENGGKLDLCGVCRGNNTCLPDRPDFQKRYNTFTVVWGIEGIDRSTTDHNNPFSTNRGTAILDPSFDITDPNAQNSIMKTCRLLNDGSPELVQKDRTDIWIFAFQEWVRNRRGRSFPVPKARALEFFYQFVQEMPQYRDQIGFEYIGKSLNVKRVTWVYVNFVSSKVSTDMSSFEAEKEFQVWEDFLEKVNGGAPSTSNKCFQTAGIWIRVFTEVSAVSGIVKGLIISAAFALAGLLFFTFNLNVSLIATVVLVVNIVFMLAFYNLMGWELGAIEAISITILVGLSVDYLFHIADAYCAAGEYESKKLTRYERTRQSLTEMGMSVLGGAVTTITSGLMLVLCTIRIFSKFGAIIAVNLLLSIIFTLVLFTALLNIMGPEGHTGDVRVGMVWLYNHSIKYLVDAIRRRKSGPDYSRV